MRAPKAYGLMYHDVLRDGSPSGRTSDGPDRYKLSWPVFVAHLDAIAAKGTPAPLAADNVFAQAPAAGWLLTFDDGGACAVGVAEELTRRDWRGHFLVTTGSIGTPGFVDADAVRELDRLGHVVGSHSVTHPGSMSLLSETDLLREWSDSVAALRDVLGKPVRAASVPGGLYRRNVARAAARAGVAILFTSEPVREPTRVDGCLVVGRYTVRRHTPASTAAAAAAGDSRTWLTQWASWNLRKPPKLLASRQYDRLRRSLLARRSGASDA